MNTLNKKSVLEFLGCGLSVNTICQRLNISYNDLCELASSDAELHKELLKWYPKYNFNIVKKTEKDEGDRDEISKRKQNGGKPKRNPEQDNG